MNKELKKIEHTGTITQVKSVGPNPKQKYYHAKLNINGTYQDEVNAVGWDKATKRDDWENNVEQRKQVPPFVNSVEVSLRLPYDAVMPSPAMRVRITLEFFEAEGEPEETK